VDRIRTLAAEGGDAVAVSPIGFPVENFEITWDLDVEASGRAADAGVAFTRAAAVDDDPRFVSMVVDLLVERLDHDPEPIRSGLGSLGVPVDACSKACCPGPRP